ncbi:MAG: hypothetical protein F6K47_25680 [Symploca sp. SIO2E6]|nr:hypothetical protein [Symploca sp. SIO2E6]
MTSIESQKKQSILYPASTLKRAERSMLCSPFLLPLFVAMRLQSVPLPIIASPEGMAQGYLKRPMSELAVENSIMWLIQVGILRREVDGQGITDSFRLTPLGRQLVTNYEQQGGTLPPPSWLDWLYNVLCRWLRLPI